MFLSNEINYLTKSSERVGFMLCFAARSRVFEIYKVVSDSHPAEVDDN